MIEITNLTVGYGHVVVLENFSATFAPSTITAITGFNGSGKSTLISAIAGDIQPMEGSISINGASLESYSLKELSRIRAVAVQSHYYWLPYTVQEILLLGNEDVIQDKFDSLLEALAITPFLQQSVTTLSGGQLQRVEIARALIRDTPLVLLDEPFASQDLESIARIEALLREARDAGRIVIFVAHERFEDLSWCDQVIDLN